MRKIPKSSATSWIPKVKKRKLLTLFFKKNLSLELTNFLHSVPRQTRDLLYRRVPWTRFLDFQ